MWTWIALGVWLVADVVVGIQAAKRALGITPKLPKWKCLLEGVTIGVLWPYFVIKIGVQETCKELW